MEKIFEDKEFHGNVKFFGDIDLPNGGQLTMVNKDNPNSPIVSIKRYGVNWWGVFETVNIINDDTMDVCKNPLSAYLATWVDFTEDFTPTRDIQALRAYLSFASTGTLGGSKYLVASDNTFQIGSANTATIPNAMSSWSNFIISGDATGTVTNYFGYRSNGTKWGTTAVTNFYGFYSEIAWASPVNGWHFYGVGDYPSFFGGEIQQTEKDITASTPPTQAEMVSALGAASAHVDASLMVKVTAGSHYRVFSDGTNWYYSAYTVGA